ncbi:hypothetical protein GGTG_05131 [Gaeumannomyces tritici R3-111a-1]|uniref:Uncharacterized protein n=1 Tax=Gaeumannomyces tritici (strain R3-111a-1) TaxID=644352 RepID=J3NV22_GAET3|nr:hypothetical protein GGTG_05131 [Gaeumannomyces tritici R3-111a-1]EJT75194.1 hypothetical protein GGTG_05131 [Gaeumannomyces tritici R3-111a-1]
MLHAPPRDREPLVDRLEQRHLDGAHVAPVVDLGHTLDPLQRRHRQVHAGAGGLVPPLARRQLAAPVSDIALDDLDAVERYLSSEALGPEDVPRITIFLHRSSERCQGEPVDLSALASPCVGAYATLLDAEHWRLPAIANVAKLHITQ